MKTEISNLVKYSKTKLESDSKKEEYLFLITLKEVLEIIKKVIFIVNNNHQIVKLRLIISKYLESTKIYFLRKIFRCINKYYCIIILKKNNKYLNFYI